MDRHPRLIMRTACAAICVLATFLVVSAPVRAQSNYVFAPIMDTTGLTLLCAGLNNLGTLIVVVQRNEPLVLPELWRGDGVAPNRQLAPRVSPNCASINDSEQVAYVAVNEENTAFTLVRNSGGALTELAYHDQAPFLTWGNTVVPSISSNGSVLFTGNGTCAGGENVYITPPLTTIYDCREFTLWAIRPGSMNDHLVAAFAAASIADGRIGVYRGSSTPLVADGAVLGAGTVVINNAGTVAFLGTLNGEYAVYTTADGMAFSRKSQVNDPSTGAPISINDSGEVAYPGGDGTGGGAIFVGRNLVTDRVIGTDDLLDNSTVVHLRLMSSEAFNNAGQVAFYARLADGREGVYRADPVDRVAPTVTAPTSITEVATETGGARGSASATLSAFLAAGTAIDNVDPAPARLLPQVNGLDVDDSTMFAIGRTTVTFRFQDAAGNIGTATSTVDVTAPVSCAADVTASAVFADGKTQLNKRTGNYVLRVRMTIANDGPTSITGPVSFVFDDLTPGVVLVSQQGQTQCASPLGNPYVGVTVGADNLWSRKERVTVDLEFSSPSPSISFTRRILAGAGQR
jgi:hypothetical protein